MSGEAIDAVMEYLVASGSAEWEDASRARARIFFKSPAEWAAIVYDFVRSSALFGGTTYTVYELRERDISTGAPFHGLDAGTMRRALEVLEREGKALLFDGSNDDELGVQFVEK
jgi:ESCRT-II complex subunit VPS25